MAQHGRANKGFHFKVPLLHLNCRARASLKIKPIPEQTRTDELQSNFELTEIFLSLPPSSSSLPPSLLLIYMQIFERVNKGKFLHNKIYHLTEMPTKIANRLREHLSVFLLFIFAILTKLALMQQTF